MRRKDDARGPDHPNYGKRYVTKGVVDPRVRALKPEQVAWIAGIIEGEGSFVAERRRSGQYATRIYASGRITVNMTDKDVIDRLAELCGGRVNFEPQSAPNRKDQWRWTFRGYENLHALCDLLEPWLGERRTNQLSNMFKVVDKVREEIESQVCHEKV